MLDKLDLYVQVHSWLLGVYKYISKIITVTYDPSTVNWPVQSTAMTVACKVKSSLANKELEYISVTFLAAVVTRNLRYASAVFV